MNRKSVVIISILAAITVAAVSVAAWAIWFRDPDVVLTPDYAPQEKEENQVPIEGDGGEKLEQPTGGGAVSLTYSDLVTIDLSDQKTTLLFGNPSKSNQDVIVQIVIQDEILVQSGRITPGNQVTALKLLKDADRKISPGTYHGNFTVLYYDPVSGEKAILNTEIPITVTVQN